jgi:hypothetical protein
MGRALPWNTTQNAAKNRRSSGVTPKLTGIRNNDDFNSYILFGRRGRGRSGWRRAEGLSYGRPKEEIR